MCEIQCDTLAELHLVNKENLQEVFSVCSRVFIHSKENKTTSSLEQQDCSASDDDLNQLSTDDAPQLSTLESVDTKHEVDTVSCYCSASHTDNISTDEHDSLRDSHVGHVQFKGLHSSDSGTDLTETKHDYESAWQKYWSQHGETIIWKSWIARYSAYINPEYLDYSTNVCCECKDDVHCCGDFAEFPKLNPAQTKATPRFSFEAKDVKKTHNSESSDGETTHELVSKNRMLIRNLSGSDSYDKLHTDVSEGWNPLSPASVDCETEAERLLSSRCGSYASSSHRTVDSMTNVTRMTVSSLDLSQSYKSSDSFSSVSSVQTSSNSSSSEEIEDIDYEQQWNVLWKNHYEEEYLKNYNKFVCSRNQDGEKKSCAEGLLERTFETLTMADAVKQEAESQAAFVKEDFPEEEMLAMGLPTSFGSSKQAAETEQQDSTTRKRRLDNPENTDDSSQTNKMKASFSLIGLEYQDDNRPKFVGTVEYKKKNIRFQNRQLKMNKDMNKRPAHIYFDDDGNAVTPADSTADSVELWDAYSSPDISSEEEIIRAPANESAESSVIQPRRRKRRRKGVVIPPEFKEKPHLMKYWKKRFSLFSRFDEGISLDEESWFSVTPEMIAKHHALKFKKFAKVIVDGFCGAGGNTIQFAAAGLNVIAIDIDPQKIEKARHNAQIYGVEKNIEFVVGDFLKMAPSLTADAVFLSPPWGGPSYLRQKVYDLEKNLQPVPFSSLLFSARLVSSNVGVFLPRNSNTHTVFLNAVGEQVEVEQNFLNDKLVALTVYYNKLIPSQ